MARKLHLPNGSVSGISGGYAPSGETRDVAWEMDALEGNVDQMAGDIAAGSVTTARDLTGGIAGAQPRSVLNQLRDRLSVLDFIPEAEHAAIRAGTSTFDCSAAIKAAMATGRPVFMSAGQYCWPSTAAYATPPQNASLEGAGRGLTTIKVTGETVAQYVFVIRYSGCQFKNITFIGNNAASGFWDGVCIGVHATLRDVAGFTCEGCVFDNFKGDAHINCYATTGYTLSDVKITDNRFISREGNCRLPMTLAAPCASIWTQSDETSVVRDVVIAHNYFAIPHRKTACQIYNARKVYITDNHVEGCGTDASIGDDCGAYAFMFYGDSPSPDNIVMDRNAVFGVRSCGVYTASASNIVIRNLTVYDQTDATEVTLPKGAVAINGPSGEHGVEISGLRAVRCRNGVSVVLAGGVTASAHVGISDVVVIEPTGVGIKIAATGAVAQALADVMISDVHIASTQTGARGIILVALGVLGPRSLRVARSTITVIGHAIELISSSGAAYPSVIELADLTLATNNTGEYIRLSTSGSGTWQGTHRLILRRISLIRGSANPGNLIRLSNVYGLTIDGVVFYALAIGGSGMLMDGARGSVRGVEFHGCTGTLVTAGGSEDLGVDKPTWSGTTHYVQKILPVEEGSPGSKYVIDGWRCVGGTTWVEVRSLTGG